MWAHKHKRDYDTKRALTSKLALSFLLLASCAHLLVLGSAPLVAAGQRTRPPVAGQQQVLGPHLPAAATTTTTAEIKIKRAEQTHTQINQANNRQTSGEQPTGANSGQRYAPNHLESILDLDHLAYLALRNYNLTDESLLKSSWLAGSSAHMALQHSHTRQQHKTSEETDEDNLASSSSSDSPVPGASCATSAEHLKGRLALMLESLILHLRNGHLRRMSLEELGQLVVASNLTEPLEALRHQRQRVNVLGTNARLRSDASESNVTEIAELRPIASGNDYDNGNGNDNDGDGEYRCIHLVTLYTSELLERLRGGGQATSVGCLLPSKVDYHESQQLRPKREGPSENGTVAPAPLMIPEPSGEPTTSVAPSHQESRAHLVDEMRLMGLCKLAINCRSSEDLVELISRPWALASVANAESQLPRRIEPRSARRRSFAGDNLERETSNDQIEAGSRGATSNTRAKSLRDSLSMSLAKLCPLVLFPLHEDEAQCLVRRDDRPPMITVWAFATLFVTIVCFCSLIGLSITPLLDLTPADSSGDSELSGMANEHPRMGSQSHHYQQQQQQSRRHRHKASLTLFEGLAVGSLVGSALFSLIPQAFELHERESNRGFLLKAFIIFSGIYLFFLSERIMRIILDTRQMRKKNKRLNHRSSTTAAVVVDMAHHHHHHNHSNSPDAYHLRPIGTHQQHSQATTFSTSTTTGSLQRQYSSSVQRHARPSTGSREGASKRDGPASVTGQRASANNSLQQPNASQQQAATNQHNIGNSKSQAQKTRRPAVVAGVATQSAIIQQLAKKMRITQSKSAPDAARNENQMAQDVRVVGQKSSIIRPKRQATSMTKGHQRKRALRHHHGQQQHQRKQLFGGQVSSSSAVKQRRKRIKRRAEKTEPQRRGSRLAASAISPESDPDDYYHHDDLSSLSSSSSPCSSSSSSFSSYALRGRRINEGLNMTVRQHTEDSRADYSSSSSSASSLSKCSSCSSFDRDFCSATLRASDSDDDNNQRRAVSKQMSEISHRYAQRQLEPAAAAAAAVGTNSPTITTFKFDDDLAAQVHDVDPMKHMGPIYVNRIKKHAHTHGNNNNQKQDISTVAWMIILGDGLHNFIDGISIGAAFSESILSGVSISVAVICEEFPHELGDFAVLVSSGMTVRQALGYNFLSACTCYLGMAVGIILGDVNDSASYISALAAGVFLYIALVDMMGELSAALESSSRDSIARTLKLLLLQNVGIAIGISIIFVLSFIDF